MFEVRIEKVPYVALCDIKLLNGKSTYDSSVSKDLKTLMPLDRSIPIDSIVSRKNNHRECKQKRNEVAETDDSSSSKKFNHSSDISDEKTPYEKMIEKRRAERKALLEELKLNEIKAGLLEAVNGFKQISNQGKKIGSIKSSKPQPKVNEPARRSERLANIARDLKKKSNQGNKIGSIKSIKNSSKRKADSNQKNDKGNETKNPAKRKKQPHLDEEQDLFKRIRYILKKINRQKALKNYVKRVQELKIDTNSKLNGTVSLIFEAVLQSQRLSVLLAKMCQELAQMKVPRDKGKGTVSFRDILLTNIEKEIDEKKSKEKLKAIKAADDDEEKGLKKKFDEEEKKINMRIMKFLEKLFKLGIIPELIMNKCIRHYH